MLETINSARGLFNYFLSKWLIIIITVVVFGVLGILYAWYQKPEYKATLSFATENEGASQLSTYAGIAAQFGLDIGGGSNSAFEGDNLIELLKSRNLIERTLLTPIEPKSNVLLINYYLTSHSSNKEAKKNDKLKDIKFESQPLTADRARDSVMYDVYKRLVKGKLTIGKRDKKLDIIDITIVDGDEYFAKRFVELLTNNAIEYYTEYKTKKTLQNVQILQRQTDSVRGTLFGNINQVATLNDLNVNPLRQIQRTGAQRKQVDVQVNGTLYGELLKNLELSKLSLRKQTPLVQIIDVPKYPLDKKKMGRLLGGIIFAFIGGFLIVVYLLIRYWLLTLKQQKASDE